MLFRSDEPTTALDVTIQAQIIDLLIELKQKLNMSILFISHDLKLVRQIADRVCVMKNGEIVEQGAVEDIFRQPQHDYTKLLVAAIEFAIFINMGLPYYLGTTLPFIASVVIGTIQLGATVDYAILMTTRYKKERNEGAGKKEAIATALSTSIQIGRASCRERV